MKNYISQNELISKLNTYNEDDKSVFNIERKNNEQLIVFVNKHVNKDDISSILLRGSCATGRQNGKSDIDLLILYEGNDNTLLFMMIICVITLILFLCIIWYFYLTHSIL